MDRTDFMNHVYWLLSEDTDNNRANSIIDAADEYAESMAPKWIPVSERLPEEKINPNTSDFEEVLCSTTFGDVRVYKFGTPYGWKEPHFWRGLNVMDEYVKAWMPKPKIPKEMK